MSFVSINTYLIVVLKVKICDIRKIFELCKGVSFTDGNEYDYLYGATTSRIMKK
jgi:hypothetical protein